MSLPLILVLRLLLILNLRGNYPTTVLVSNFLSQVEIDLFEISKVTLGCSNFLKEEWQSLCSLADGRNVVIKIADKGLCEIVRISLLKLKNNLITKVFIKISYSKKR